MERSSINSSGLEWENLGTYAERPPVEILPRQIDFSAMSSSGCSTYDQHHPPISASLQPLDDFGKLGYLHPYKDMYDDVMTVQNNIGGTISPSGSGEPLTGLRLGRQKEYGAAIAMPSPSSLPVSSVPTKRSRASYQNMQNPCCQVEGCNLDLKLAKDYHRRHRICESHSKSPKVIVAGMERRFCQQCSRFHELSEFDDKKRSCRRRLSDHNARRRRVQPESIHQLGSAGMQPAALYDQRPQSILLNGLPISLVNPTWENANTPRLIRPPMKAGGLNGTPCFATSEVHNSISNLHVNSERLSSVHGSNQCLHVNSTIAPDLLSAQSLLSSNSWSLNEGESAATSMEGLMSYNNPVMRQSEPQAQQHLSLFESNSDINPSAATAEGGGGGGPVSLAHSINLHDADNTHLQEFHLFYDPGRFYSTHSHRNL